MLHNKQQSETTFIYHERQDSLLCGQHCINNLLQGPYFNAVDLSDIAIELDSIENSLIESYDNDNNKYNNNSVVDTILNDVSAVINGRSAHAHKISSHSTTAKSNNVDDSGNYSIQVLKCALQRFNNIELEPLYVENEVT
jgi:ataxin-3